MHLLGGTVIFRDCSFAPINDNYIKVVLCKERVQNKNVKLRWSIDKISVNQKSGWLGTIEMRTLNTVIFWPNLFAQYFILLSCVQEIINVSHCKKIISVRWVGTWMKISLFYLPMCIKIKSDHSHIHLYLAIPHIYLKGFF